MFDYWEDFLLRYNPDLVDPYCDDTSFLETYYDEDDYGNTIWD